MRDIALVIPSAQGEVRVSLHPISLALVLAEIIEDTARRRCYRRGHSEPVDGYCGRCGTSLPDYGSPYRSFKRPVSGVCGSC